jgi:predicted nucleic acid-binding protein
MLNLVDTNILLRWIREDDRDYEAVNKGMEHLLKQGDHLCYTSQNLGEFWRVCTRPVKLNGYGLTVLETDLRANVIERTLSILPDTPEIHGEWRKLLVTYSVSGTQVHDARLVAAMKVHGVKRILTLNRTDFVRYQDIIEAVDPRR